jgi:hypothetical protein
LGGYLRMSSQRKQVGDGQRLNKKLGRTTMTSTTGMDTVEKEWACDVKNERIREVGQFPVPGDGRGGRKSLHRGGICFTPGQRRNCGGCGVSLSPIYATCGAPPLRRIAATRRPSTVSWQTLTLAACTRQSNGRASNREAPSNLQTPSFYR